MADPGAMALGGAERAAILLLSLGEEGAADILRHLGPKEVQKVGTTMAALSDVSAGQVSGVIKRFLDDVGQHTALGIDSANYLRSALTQALGDDKAKSVIDRILLGGRSQGLESLKWMEPRAIGEMIRYEHPQIIALVLAYLDGDLSAEVLAQFDESVRVNVMMRVATLETVQPAALAELNEILERQVSGPASAQGAALGGPKAAAGILNHVDSDLNAQIMQALKEAEPELEQQIQDMMFVFEDLGGVADTAIQTLLREVSSESLLLALKAADPPLQEKFLSNMSKRAAEMLRDDMEAKGPVRVSEVEEAKREVVGIARRLSDEGQIMLDAGGGEDFV